MPDDPVLSDEGAVGAVRNDQYALLRLTDDSGVVPAHLGIRQADIAFQVPAAVENPWTGDVLRAVGTGFDDDESVRIRIPVSKARCRGASKQGCARAVKGWPAQLTRLLELVAGSFRRIPPGFQMTIRPQGGAMNGFRGNADPPWSAGYRVTAGSAP
jgi:hypothetical protein